MKKTLCIVLLVALLLPASLVAQGSKESAAAKSTVEYTPVGTFPIVKTPITVDIMVAQPPCVEDYNTNRFTKYMEELTGIKVNYIMIPEQAATEKLALVLASGDYPDAFLGFGVNNTLETTYGAQEGLFMPLNKFYSKEWMPNMMKAFEEFPGGIGFMTNIDGNIYSLPRLEGCYHCSNQAKLFVYQPFLDKLGMKMPTTTDEFYQVLKAMKEQDANGNGKADEIPLAGSIIGWSDQVERFLLNSFIYTDLDTNINANADDNVGYMMNNGKVDTAVNKPAFREGLAFINKLYKEGLLYNGSFTQDSSQLTQLVESSAQPVVGFAAGGWRGQFATIGGERFNNFRAIAPLKGPKGAQYSVAFFQNPEIGELVLSSDTKYAEAIMR
ncbi:MAG: extracellular solute-binding protein, partial [Sphaerochaeta sp.]